MSVTFKLGGTLDTIPQKRGVKRKGSGGGKGGGERGEGKEEKGRGGYISWVISPLMSLFPAVAAQWYGIKMYYGTVRSELCNGTV